MFETAAKRAVLRSHFMDWGSFLFGAVTGGVLAVAVVAGVLTRRVVRLRAAEDFERRVL